MLNISNSNVRGLDNGNLGVVESLLSASPGSSNISNPCAMVNSYAAVHAVRLVNGHSHAGYKPLVASYTLGSRMFDNRINHHNCPIFALHAVCTSLPDTLLCPYGGWRSDASLLPSSSRFKLPHLSGLSSRFP